jgi:hypothetical protein
MPHSGLAGGARRPIGRDLPRRSAPTISEPSAYAPIGPVPTIQPLQDVDQHECPKMLCKVGSPSPPENRPVGHADRPVIEHVSECLGSSRRVHGSERVSRESCAVDSLELDLPPLPLATGQAYARRLMLPAERRPVVDGEPRTTPVRVAYAARRGGAIRPPSPDGIRPPHRHLHRPHPGASISIGRPRLLPASLEAILPVNKVNTV